jgi:membrane protein YqaA with SNARE-associated domain
LQKIMAAIRRMKEWVESFAAKPYALWALFAIAFIEASFFPIPPDALLLALAVLYPKRSYTFALVCTAGSVLGAFLGYYIGYAFFELIGSRILEFYGAMEHFDVVLEKYREHGFIAIVLAGFTPIPFKVFTIAAGFNTTIPLGTLALASLIGRSLRFFLVATFFYFFGAQIKVYVDRYFDILAIAFMVLLIGGFIVVRYLF